MILCWQIQRWQFSVSSYSKALNLILDVGFSSSFLKTIFRSFFSLVYVYLRFEPPARWGVASELEYLEGKVQVQGEAGGKMDVLWDSYLFVSVSALWGICVSNSTQRRVLQRLCQRAPSPRYYLFEILRSDLCSVALKPFRNSQQKFRNWAITHNRRMEVHSSPHEYPTFFLMVRYWFHLLHWVLCCTVCKVWTLTVWTSPTGLSIIYHKPNMIHLALYKEGFQRVPTPPRSFTPRVCKQIDKPR